MFEVLFCVDADTVTVILCDSFLFGSLAIWVTDDIESKLQSDETELLFVVCITALCYKKNNVNDVDHTLQTKGEECLLKYNFKSLPSR